jgi:hypothetical protein
MVVVDYDYIYQQSKINIFILKEIAMINEMRKLMEAVNDVDYIEEIHGHGTGVDLLDKPKTTPKHDHDCASCTYYGTVLYGGDYYDLYHCEREDTYIARFGPEGEYISLPGFVLDRSIPYPEDHPISIVYDRHNGLTESYEDDLPPDAELMPCPECAGTGYSHGAECEYCDGTGEVFDS